MQAQTNRFIRERHLQRRLRSNMTDAEQKLWRALRGRQLLNCKFRRQHPFGSYILDFICLERKLVIEVDGGQHADSESDAVRDELLGEAGFTLMRFWNNEVLDQLDAVLESIYRGLQESTANPSPPRPSP